MFSFSTIATFFTAGLALTSSVLASPAADLPLRHRAAAVPTPDVTYPHSGATAVWVIGFSHNVTWDASGVSGTGGSIFLAKGGIVDPSPLAAGFSLTTGRTEVVVPSVEPATDYTVVLTINGSSAASAPFTIANSKSDLPSSGTPVTSGITTVAFPSTTIVTSITAINAASSAASSVASSLSASASSALSSGLSAASSIASSASASLSSARSSATAPSGSASGSSTSGTTSPSGNAAGRVQFDFAAAKLVAVSAVIAFSASVLVY